MLSDNITAQGLIGAPATIGPISWWSWRPGIRPQNALLLGVPLTLLALLLTLLGLITLIAGIEDSLMPPLLLPGTVLQRNSGTATRPPQLTIHLHGPAGFPTNTTLAVSHHTFQQIMNNAPVLVGYSPHLHVAYELEYAGQHYSLPSVSAAGNPIGAVALLLLGLIMLPYPALLAHWGWQDLLIERYKRRQQRSTTAYIVDRRVTSNTRIARPGFAGRSSRPWYGLALLLDAQEGTLRTFSVNEETYKRVQNDTRVNIVYSPHLHYVYTIQKIQE